MNYKEIQEMARKSGKTPRQYCLDKIREWQDNLQMVSEQYTGLDDEEFQKKFEKELDRRRSENN